jgi:hypothetical protein
MEYAGAAVVYREMRTLLGSWCQENGYKRQPKTEASWMKPLGSDEKLYFGLQCGRWGGAAQGGNDFHGLIQTEPAAGPPGSAINRQTDFSLCLLQSELDELREIQNWINRHRPRTAEIEGWMREDSSLGESTRDMYKQFASGEKPYRMGDFVYFRYFSVGDARLHLAFLLRRLPGIVARFLEGRVAAPNPVPQPSFMAKLRPRG